MPNLVNENPIKVRSDWKKIFKQYSFWIMVSSAILTLVEQILPFAGLLEPTMTVTSYAFFMFGLNMLAVIARFVQQKNLWQYPDSTPQEENKDV